MDVQVFLKYLLCIVIIVAVNDSQNKHCLHLPLFFKLMFSEKAKEFKKQTSIFFLRIL